MLTTILNYQIIFFLIGAAGAVGIISKAVSQVMLKKLVTAASNMNKSNHSLIRLVRAKFEHACMVNDKVENVGAFVDKYMYEYKVWGIKLHTWRQLEIRSIWLCALLGILGAGISYIVAGQMDEQVLHYGAMGGIGAVTMFLVHTASNEKLYMSAAKTYMVDFLENVLAHRYAKIYGQAGVENEGMAVQEEIAENEDRSTEAVEMSADEGMTTWEVKVQEKPAKEQKARLKRAREKEKMKDRERESNSGYTVPLKPMNAMPDDLEEAREKLRQLKEETPQDNIDDIAPREELIREILQEFLA